MSLWPFEPVAWCDFAFGCVLLAGAFLLVRIALQVRK